MTGLSTLYLRVNGNSHCVPIYITRVDDVIDMLQRGKSLIQAVEGNG